MLAFDTYFAARSRTAQWAVLTVVAGDAAWWPSKKAHWSGDVSSPFPQPPPAQPRLPQQVTQPDIACSKFPSASPAGNWPVWGSQSCWCTALPFSEICLFQLDFHGAALLLGNGGTCFDTSNPWVLQRHAVFPVTSCTFLQPRSHPSPT